jgi:hypothetical protein
LDVLVHGPHPGGEQVTQSQAKVLAQSIDGRDRFGASADFP